jgi:DNA-directed RNA polymerase specialized sigma24 family protein
LFEEKSTKFFVKLDKSEFTAVRRERFRLRAVKNRLDEIREAVGYVSPNLSGLPRKPKDGMKSDLFAKLGELIDISAEYSKFLVECHLKIAKLENCMKNLPENVYAVLRCRYLEGMSWRKVAKATNYSEQHCRNINSRIFKVSTK